MHQHFGPFPSVAMVILSKEKLLSMEHALEPLCPRDSRLTVTHSVWEQNISDKLLEYLGILLFNSKCLAMTLKQICYVFITSFFITNAQAQDLSQIANDFLKTLSTELKSKTLFSLNDSERYNMNFIPIEREGPTFHDFTDKQKDAAIALLMASLGTEGFRKTSEIMALEKVLFKLENNELRMPDGTPIRRDPLNYHFCIFGDPAAGNLWGWRFEGHHISLNFTSANNQIASSTPSFFGSNPAIVEVEGFDKHEVLKKETELGFLLVNSLTVNQQEVAIFSTTAPREIITGNNRNVQNIPLAGISYKEFTEDQKGAFMKLLNVYIDNYELGFAETLRIKIKKAGLENLAFAWAGSLKPGKGHYYRIQGPMLLIEYDNIQNNANHVHTVVRDLTNDFAEDILREHYHKDH